MIRFTKITTTTVGLLALSLSTAVQAQSTQDDAAVAAAEGPADPISVSGSIAVLNEYRWRGVNLTDGNVAVQGAVNVNHESGAYAGLWASNLSDTPIYGMVELDVIAGYATEVAPGTTLDIGATYYVYPDGKKGLGPTDFLEPAVKVTHTIGPVRATAGAAYAYKQAALGNDDSLYLSLNLSSGVPNTPVTVVGSLGRTKGALAAITPSRTIIDWSLGADYVLGPVTLGVRYIDTDIPKTGVKAIDTLYDATVVGSVTLSF